MNDMEVQEVHLTTPTDHSIYLGPQDEHYSSPLPGSVQIILPSSCIDSSGYPTLSVKLTRTVTVEQQCAATASQRRSEFMKTLRWSRTTTQPQATPECEPSASSSTETITRCDLWHTQCLVERCQEQGTTKLKFDFGLPVPFDIPPTTETVLGTLSYAITATSTSPTGRTATTTATRPIQILRRAIPGHTRTTQHMRTFREHQVRIYLDLTPKECPGSGNKASYTARLRATPTITEGTRPTQMRHVVIKDLKWRVEETTIAVSKPGSSSSSSSDHVYHKEQCLRQLSRGTMTGRWSATGGYPKSDTTDATIQISFDVSVPTRTAAAAPVLETSAIDTSQPCLHHQRPCQCSFSSPHTHDPGDNAAAHAMLATHHQLKLDIMAGEDVIDQETGKLVDRKPLWKLFGAFFPLPVYDFLSSHEMPHTAFSANDLPPTYEAAPTPPDYDGPS